MTRYFLDSNVCIYHFDGAPETQSFFASLTPEEDKLFYSFITRIELLGYPKLTSREKREIDAFLSAFTKVNMTDEIENLVIRLRQSRRIKIPDAIIAASAIYTESVLVTRNEKDFRKIKGLKVLNPFEKSEG